MTRHPRTTVRRLHRLIRPAVALVLVLAQGVAAFGFPFARPRNAAHVSACGCDHAGGPASGCCCGTGACAIPPPPPEPTPAPEPTCPRCHDKELTSAREVAAPAKPTVTWVAAWQARQCRGEGPLGVMAELPTVPPCVPAAARPQRVPSGLVRLVDRHASLLPSAPLDPPPRLG